MQLGILKKQRAQSMAEFALVVPVFMLFVLGIAQVSLIFINALMLKYDAYEIARVAVVYPAEIRTQPAKKAGQLLEIFSDAVNNFGVINSAGGFQAAAAGFIGALPGRILSKYAGSGLKVEREVFDNSTADDPEFIRVTVSYDMPLKVPVINAIFGFFQKNAFHAAGSVLGTPFYTIKATACMRAEQ